ncbi:hypothetical protein B0H14DRAFT_2618902 [Mycena olivaceomarginata]|nr:hypothetical protein B0H14DRAFT_2618902 [Mycena olivaceomarginata]
MAKLSRMAAAARKRHRIKRGEVDPKEAAVWKAGAPRFETNDLIKCRTLAAVFPKSDQNRYFLLLWKHKHRETVNPACRQYSGNIHLYNQSVGSAVLRRAGTSVKKFFVGKVSDTAPSPAPEPRMGNQEQYRTGPECFHTYCEKYGKTKKSKAKKLQKSVSAYFKILGHTPSSSNMGQAVRMDIDSEIECLAGMPSVFLSNGHLPLT